MNPSPLFSIWWKEVRAILPYFLTTVACMWVPFVLGMGARVLVCYVAFVVGSTLVASNVFARDFSDRTILWQFVIPAARSRMLLRKLVLILALQLIMLASFLFTAQPHSLERDSFWFVIVASVVVVFSSGFWATQFKNPLYSAVMTGAAPLLLFALVASFLEVVLPKLTGGWTFYGLEQEIVVGLVCFTSLAAGVFGFKRWLNLELFDTQQSVSRLDDAFVGGLTRDSAFAARSIFATLVRKELLLLRFVLWTTVAFIGTALFISIADIMLVPTGGRNQEFVRLLAVVILTLYFAATPLLVGALAFTEEKQIGNHSWNLTVACSAKLQFRIKLLTSLAVNILAGLVVPLLTAIVYASLKMDEVVGEVFEPGAALAFVSLNLVLFSTAAWSSAVSDASLKSILASGIVIFVAFLVYEISGMGRDPDFRMGLFGVIASAGTLAFCRANFQKLQIGYGRWLAQMVAVLVFSSLILQIIAVIA